MMDYATMHALRRNAQAKSEAELMKRLQAEKAELVAALEALHTSQRTFSDTENWCSFDEDARAMAEMALARVTGSDLEPAGKGAQ
jgi:hypothetical protein